MNILKNFFIILFSLIFTIILIEVIYNIFFRVNLIGDKLDRVTFYEEYQNQELDKSLPIRHKFNGGECVKRGLLTKEKRMNWHPRIGANDNEVDIDCINKLFTSKTTNVVFFGGSSMFNYEAPNYLTSIDYYAFGDKFEKYRSINLANSGARMSNNLSSFVEHIPKINNVDYVIFMDGVNDFTSVALGANPLYDTYWAQGVKQRINNPKIIILEKIIEKSIFFEFLFKYVFGYKSIRDKTNVRFANKNAIEVAAEDYTFRKKIIEILCKNFSIKCIFTLQPAIFFDKTRKSFDEKIYKYYQKKFFDENINLYLIGYKKIILENKNIIDLSEIFNGKENIFIDASHFNKNGSKILGEKFYKILEENN
jgi:hypothetical protein